MAENKTTQPKADDVQASQPTSPADTKAEELVSVPKELLEQMNARLQDLESQAKSEDPSSIAEAIKRHQQKKANPIVKVRFWEGKLVTNYGRSYEKRDELDPNKYVQFLEVYTGDEVHTVLHEKFMETSEVEFCEVLEKKETPRYENQGTTTVKEVPKGEYHTVDTGEEVPMLVVGADISYKLKVRGEEVVLDERAIN